MSDAAPRTKNPTYLVFRKEGTGSDLNVGSTWKLLTAEPIRAPSRKEAIRKATESRVPVEPGGTGAERRPPADGTFLAILASQVPTPLTRRVETKEVELFS